MNLLGIESLNAAADLWGAALWRASWQGGVAILVAWSVSRLWRSLAPAPRCWLWRLAYLKLLVAFLSIAPLRLPLLPDAAVSPAALLPAAPTVTATAPDRSPGRLPVGRTAPDRVLETAPRVPKPAFWLSLLWLCGAAFSATRICREWIAAGRLRRSATRVDDSTLADEAGVLGCRLGLRRIPPIAACAAIDSPVLVGIRRPMILLPAALVESGDRASLRWMLAHELAHAQRRDLLWNWLPAVAQIVSFFSPMVWLAHREWELAQEVACDARAVATVDGPVADYGDVLLAVAARASTPIRGGWATAGVAEGFWTLERRLFAMRTPVFTARRAGWFASTVLAMVGISTLVPLQLEARPDRAVPAVRTLTAADPQPDLRIVNRHTPNEVAFSPDGRVVASAGAFEPTVRLWDVAKGALHRILLPPGDALPSPATSGPMQTEMTSVAFSPDGRSVASGEQRMEGKYREVGLVRLWDARSGVLRRTLRAHSRRVAAVAYSPDGQTLASGGLDSRVRLWNSGTGQMTREFTAPAFAIAFSPDGSLLACASSAIGLWNVRTGEEVRSLSGHRGGAWAMVFSPDGRTIVSGGEDRTVRVWDARSGRLRRTLKGHTDAIRAVAVSPDGRLLASAGQDNLIRLWDAATGAPRQPLAGHQNWVVSLKFSPDGVTLASGSFDHTIRLWHVP